MAKERTNAESAEMCLALADDALEDKTQDRADRHTEADFYIKSAHVHALLAIADALKGKTK